MNLEMNLDLVKLFTSAKELVSEGSTKEERVAVVTDYCRGTLLSKPEIFRLYFVVVLPEFAEEYAFLDKLCKMENYELFFCLVSCALMESGAESHE